MSSPVDYFDNVASYAVSGPVAGLASGFALNALSARIPPSENIMYITLKNLTFLGLNAILLDFWVNRSGLSVVANPYTAGQFVAYPMWMPQKQLQKDLGFTYDFIASYVPKTVDS